VVHPKGLPQKWYPPPSNTDVERILRQPSVRVLSTLGHILSGILHPKSTLDVPNSFYLPIPAVEALDCGQNPQDPDDWQDESPGLEEGSEWCDQRIQIFEAATAQCVNPQEVTSEGLALLEAHRSNYGPDGSQHLVVLWWEFPPLHWEELQLGAFMNFIVTPPAKKEPNSPFTIGQLSTAEGFVNELIAFRVLDTVPEGARLLNTCPLFMVHKPGQPGQW
jgi:hypothetical protein